MTQRTTPKVRDVPQMVSRGFRSYRTSPRSGSIMAILVLGVYGFGRTAAVFALASDEVLWAIVIDLASPIIATTLALPWFHVALASDRNEEIPFEQAWHRSSGSFLPMLRIAIPFWIVIFLGFVLLFGTLSLLIVIFFGLFGFVVADERLRAWRALRRCLRLGRGAWLAVAALAITLLVVNGLAALPLLTGQLLIMVLAAPLLVVSTNVSMGAGAALFIGLQESTEGAGPTASRFS